MKLKFELVNGYGVLVDHDKEMVLFAEKELGLDVPVFEWRDFDIEKLANEKLEFSFNKVAFIQGYKSNPAKYTESDLRKAIELALIDAEKSVLWSVNYHICLSNKIIQSLQKYPKYVVIENEDMEFGVEKEYRPKLFTNSEGKQQGILKELIWD